MTEKVLGSLQIDFVLSLFGALDSHTDTIEKAFNVRIAAGENGIVITGENADNVQTGRDGHRAIGADFVSQRQYRHQHGQLCGVNGFRTQAG